MSTRLLKILAALMLVGSVMLVAVAIRFGQTPKGSESDIPVAQSDAPLHKVVTAKRPIQAGETIGEADLGSTMVATVPPDVIEDPAQAVGKRIATAIAAGTPILQSHFPVGSALAQALHPGERAIALKVDEVVGVGGFLQSGDRVDVIAYFRGDDRRIKKDQAVVILDAVRVLAYGDELPRTPGTPASADAGKAAKGSKARGTAVVAVDAFGAARLALADHAGSLRLALHPIGAAETGRGDVRVVSLDDLAAVAVKAAVEGKPKGRVVELYRGPKLTEMELQ